MNDLMIFNNNEFGEIRGKEINGQPWVCLSDVCKILDIKNARDCKSRLNQDGVVTTDGVDSKGRKNQITFINESNLYKVIFQSRKTEAEKFTEWVTSEVLPSIRKNGGYLAGQEEMTEDEIMAKALLFANKKIEDLKNNNTQLAIQNSKLTVDNAIMKPKAEYFDDLVDRNLLTNFRDTAKELKINQKSFIQFLLDKKYICRDERGQLKPYSHRNNGLFELKEGKNEKTGWAGTQTLITPKGRETFRLLFQEA